ncbi:hypothetical protein PHMEG_00012468 [Phytophthora megakarya]|uniref:Uncharacterized protein n=1 Tax=Phytophthora megakarya TaxID=4795 RepID=A0A225WAD0_9STRA|nr:hypothetical protein PHMEG_00012468 [Phytophthora megakarya]
MEIVTSSTYVSHQKTEQMRAAVAGFLAVMSGMIEKALINGKKTAVAEERKYNLERLSESAQTIDALLRLERWLNRIAPSHN